jgi:hypothetical protein
MTITLWLPNFCAASHTFPYSQILPPPIYTRVMLWTWIF